MNSIPRVNRMIQHELYNQYSMKNEVAEAQRVYCRHGSDHGLSVARITYIFLLEKRITSVSKEVVYAAGLLHDIGRWVEYDTKEDHAKASERLAVPILRDCDFSDQEIETIRQAILEHRLKRGEASSTLGQALAQADDWARDCRSCKSKMSCYKYTQSMEEIIL